MIRTPYLVLFMILISVGVGTAFATHETPPTLDCPVGSHDGNMGPRSCIADNIPHPGAGNPTCLCDAANSHPDCVHSGDLQPDGVCVRTSGLEYIAGTETLDPPITIPEQCVDNAVLDTVSNHCVPDFGEICSAGTMFQPSTIGSECVADVTQDQLDVCNTDLDTASTDLATCNADLTTAQDSLADLFANNQCSPLADTIPNVLICIVDLNDRVLKLEGLLSQYGPFTQEECDDIQAAVDQKIANDKNVSKKLLSDLETCIDIYG